ncbi:hypothetical protein GGI35DRAFT_25544 [Trichoderma velutinum]
MSSEPGEPVTERGISIPRIVRDNGFCLTCRRLGKQCDSTLPICCTCQKNGVECVQPISAYPRVQSNIRKRRRNGSESEEERPRVRTRPASEAAVEPTAESEAETEILTPSAPEPQSESAPQTQPQQQPQLKESEGDENSTSGPEWSVFLNAISREIDQAQQSLLRQTTGHVRLSVTLSVDSLDDDPDHDYAAYYDYQYDVDSEDDDVGEPDENERRSHTPSALEATAPTSTMYQIRNTWTGEGPPPLVAHLRDFIDYMRECHLSHASSDVLPLSLLPASEHTTAETLRYYVLRPTNRGTRPLPDINPTNPKLIDLAYSNPLVLQLIIAERADHREVSSARLPTGERAESFYRAAIGAFAPKIRGYLAGNEEDMLSLTMGSLILALTEKARLDKHGQAHNYPTAAARILIMLTTCPHEEICRNLPDILVEYYMHTTMFACLTADITVAERIPFVSDTFRDTVDEMAAANYNGRLCGTWLPIMVSVQNIFTLGIAMRPYVIGPLDIPRPGPSTGYSPDLFVTFGRIQERLFTFEPALDETSADFEAAVLWRNAALLYLWSLLDWPHAAKPAGPYAEMIHNAFRDAIGRLAEIDRDDRVNKTICWPLLIVGCYAMDKRHQSYIGSRLLDISNRFKVGNALETYFVLHHVWSQPAVRRSPWLVHKSIRATKCWGNLVGNRFL